MGRYADGQVLPLRQNGEFVANARVVRTFQDDEGTATVETEIVELSSSYRGTLKLGARITFPEDGFVGTFENP